MSKSVKHSNNKPIRQAINIRDLKGQDNSSKLMYILNGDAQNSIDTIIG